MFKRIDSNKAFLLLFSVLLVVGIFFRVFDAEGKIYWTDETYTSLRVSGHTGIEVVDEVFNGEVISNMEL
ncbi:hypothetical protein HC928_13370, partial [bacterium]|nr:hypothetical protein [bacterium]